MTVCTINEEYSIYRIFYSTWLGLTIILGSKYQHKIVSIQSANKFKVSKFRVIFAVIPSFLPLFFGTTECVYSSVIRSWLELGNRTAAVERERERERERKRERERERKREVTVVHRERSHEQSLRKPANSLEGPPSTDRIRWDQRGETRLFYSLTHKHGLCRISCRLNAGYSLTIRRPRGDRGCEWRTDWCVRDVSSPPVCSS